MTAPLWYVMPMTRRPSASIATGWRTRALFWAASTHHTVQYFSGGAKGFDAAGAKD